MRIGENKKGQFIMIAIMIIAIMMVSLTVTMYNASTYYKSERWEEYITLVDHVKLNTIRLLESSLSNHTSNANNTSILQANLVNWQKDLKKAYPGLGVVLTYELPNGFYEAFNMSLLYNQGLNLSWNQPTSISTVRATFTLSLASIGLEGYRFEAAPSVILKILNVTSTEMNVAVKGEDTLPIAALKKENFNVTGANIVSITPQYDGNDLLIYKILCDKTIPNPAIVAVTDPRGIRAVSVLD